MGINVSGTIGPIICGGLGDTGNPADFKWAFIAAGIGMLISVVVFKLLKDKYVRTPSGEPLGDTPAHAINNKKVSPILIFLALFAFSALVIGLLYIDAKVFNYLSYLLLAAVLGIGFMIFTDTNLSKIEKHKISVI